MKIHKNWAELINKDQIENLRKLREALLHVTSANFVAVTLSVFPNENGERLEGRAFMRHMAAELGLISPWNEFLFGWTWTEIDPSAKGLARRIKCLLETDPLIYADDDDAIVEALKLISQLVKKAYPKLYKKSDQISVLICLSFYP